MQPLSSSPSEEKGGDQSDEDTMQLVGPILNMIGSPLKQLF